jgi:hypothetical protein
MPYNKMAKMPSWTGESPAPVNVEKYTTLCENVSKSDIQISIHSFILSVISLLIFICYMHPFFRMEWIESIQKMTPSDLGAFPNGWPTSAILR